MMASSPFQQLFIGTPYTDITPTNGVEIKRNDSRYVNSGCIHLFLRIKINSAIANNFIFTIGKKIKNSGIVVPIFSSTSEWDDAEKIQYGYVSPNGIQGTLSTTYQYITIDQIVFI